MKRAALLTFIVISILPCLTQAYIYRVGAYPTTASSWVVVESTYAYVIDSTNLLILNIADPANPALTGTLTIPGQPQRMDIENGYAYIAAGDSGKRPCVR